MAIVDALREDILTGCFPPGTLLLQTELANRFSVSRIPVRDALQILVAEKLVRIVPGKGARVIALSWAELVEVYDLRIMLECDLLRRATVRADSRAHADAEYALSKSSLEAGRAGWRSGDWLFHRTLYMAAERPRQIAIVEELRMTCALHAGGHEGLVVNTPRWLEDHEAILSDFVAGRADEAAGRLELHIAGARDHLLVLIDPDR